MKYIITEDLNNNRSFGLAIIENDTVVRSMNDIFTDRNEAMCCIELFNNEQLEPIHLDQIIEGYLQYGEI